MSFAVGMLKHALTMPYNKEGELAEATIGATMAQHALAWRCLNNTTYHLQHTLHSCTAHATLFANGDMATLAIPARLTA
jgi:hypothetical protein